MTSRTMNPRIFAIRSRVGQRKSTATTCICVHPPPVTKRIESFIAAMPTLFYIRKIFRLSIELKKHLAWNRNIRIRLLWNAFPCPFSSIHLIAWSFIRRAHHFLAATAFTLYLPLTSPPHSRPNPSCNTAANFLTDRACFQPELSSPRYNLSPQWNNILPRQQLPVIFFAFISRKNAPNHGKRSNQVIFYTWVNIFLKYSKNAYFIKITGTPECFVVCGYKTRNLTVFCAFEFTCAWQSRLLFTKTHLLYFFLFGVFFIFICRLLFYDCFWAIKKTGSFRSFFG